MNWPESFAVAVVALAISGVAAVMITSVAPGHGPKPDCWEAPKKEEPMAPYTYNIIRYRVIDGDTVECVLDLGFDVHKRVSIRLDGVDTPERRGWQKSAGIPVGLCLQHYAETHRLEDMTATSYEWGTYAGRALGDIHFGQGNPSATQFILEHQLGKPYLDDRGNRAEYSDEDLRVIRQRCHDELIYSFGLWLHEAMADGRITEQEAEDRVMVEFGQEFDYLGDDLVLTDEGQALYNQL